MLGTSNTIYNSLNPSFKILLDFIIFILFGKLLCHALFFFCYFVYLHRIHTRFLFPRGAAQNQDQGSSRDVAVILAEFKLCCIKVTMDIYPVQLSWNFPVLQLNLDLTRLHESRLNQAKLSYDGDLLLAVSVTCS